MHVLVSCKACGACCSAATLRADLCTSCPSLWCLAEVRGRLFRADGVRLGAHAPHAQEREALKAQERAAAEAEEARRRRVTVTIDLLGRQARGPRPA